MDDYECESKDGAINSGHKRRRICPILSACWWPPADCEAGPSRLALIHAHEQDANVAFAPGDHRYYFKGISPEETRDMSTKIISVTSLIKVYCPPFDTEKSVLTMLNNPRFPQGPKYKVYKDILSQIPRSDWKQRILQHWDTERDLASKLGTQMHFQLECLLNSEAPLEDISSLESPSKEVGFAADYISVMYGLGFVPYRTEMIVYLKGLLLAGSIDLLWIHQSEVAVITDRSRRPKLVLCDWKRSKQIQVFNCYQTMTKELHRFSDCNLAHYTIQANIYRRILEMDYGVDITSMHIVVCHPSNSSYLQIELEHRDDVVDTMFANRSNELAEKTENVCLDAPTSLHN